MEDIIARTATMALAGLLLVSAVVKAAHFWQFAAVVRSWGFSQPRNARAVGRGLIGTELLVGAVALTASIAGYGELWARMALLALFVVFIVGQAIILRRAKDASCGCFGRPVRLGTKSMARTGALALAALAVLGPAAGVSPASAQQPPAWAHASGTTTGIASVDAAIAAVTSGNTAGLSAQLQFTDVACSTNPGLGGFQCPSGTPNGTVLSAVRAGSCELAGVARDSSELQQALSTAARAGLYLHSVAQLGGGAGDPFPAPKYLAFFGTASDPGTAGGSGSHNPVVLGITDQGVVELRGGCAASVADAASQPGLTFILAPRSVGGAQTTPTSSSTPVAPQTGDSVEEDDGTAYGLLWVGVALAALAAVAGGFLILRRP